MSKVFAEICVLNPEDAIGVIETLIGESCAVVIRSNAYDPCEPTIFVHAYGEIDDDVDVEGSSVLDHWDSMLEGTGGDVVESGAGHTDVDEQVAPPFELAFAIDVFDDTTGIRHRLSCAEYSRDRLLKMAVQASALLANAHDKSVGNALARRIMRMALGPIEEGEAEGLAYAVCPLSTDPVGAAN